MERRLTFDRAQRDGGFDGHAAEQAEVAGTLKQRGSAVRSGVRSRGERARLDLRTSVSLPARRAGDKSMNRQAARWPPTRTFGTGDAALPCCATSRRAATIASVWMSRA